MADESVESRDPGSERSDQSPRDGESRQPDRSSNRRRMLVTGLLTAPTVMTISVRAARAGTKKDSPSCAASLNPSHHCT